MYGYIYMTTNILNNKKYIGCKKSNKFLGNKYLGSGTLIRKAISKYGKENFEVKLLEECNSFEELADKEIYWISYYNAVNDNSFYNLSVGSEGKKGYATKGSKRNEEFKRQASIRNKGKIFGDTAKMAETMKTKRWVTNGIEEIYTDKYELQNWLDKGYKRGRLSQSREQKLKSSKSHKEYCKNLSKEELSNKYGNRKGKPNPRKGTKFDISDEQKERWTKLRKGRIWVHKEDIKTQIFKEELNDYLQKGYHKGMYKDKCKICGSTTIENIV